MEQSSTRPFYQLVLMRNGESEFTKNNLVSGWIDSDISYRGECQSEDAGRLLLKKGIEFDIAFTSFLRRAIKTCHIVLEQMGLHWIPVYKSWRLNARMCGMLQGCDLSKLILHHGDDQVNVWRRDYHGTPPSLSQELRQHPIYEEKYALLDKSIIPDTECLHNACERLLPFWNDKILPAIKDGNRVLIVAHGSTLHVLMRFLDHIPDHEGVNDNLPPCVPLVYDFDEDMTPIRHYYMRDDTTVAGTNGTAINGPHLNPHQYT